MLHALKSLGSSAPAQLAYTLAERASMLCASTFEAHLAVWREALTARDPDGGFPSSFLAAWRKVVRNEAAAGAMDAEDALAAAVAIAELGTPEAEATAKALLQDLHAQGNLLAGVIAAAEAIREGKASALAQARFDLIALSNAIEPSVRAASLCLLGDSYLSDDKVTEPVAFRFHQAAARLDGPAAAPAHFRLGQWYEAQDLDETRGLALSHFEKGAELGCRLCTHSLARVYQPADPHLAQELSEIAQLADLVAGPPPIEAAQPPPTSRVFRFPQLRERPQVFPFINSMRGLLRAARA